MKPPYRINSKILKLISAISEKIGEINAQYLDKQSPQLRKQNKIKTIHSSLKIEGNTLTEDQVSAIIEDKKVLGPKKDILEVINAIEVYDKLSNFNALKETDFLKAHKLLMKGLIPENGKYRTQNVGIAKGGKIEHVAPPYKNVPHLMKKLFDYLKNDDDLMLIKSCVFHYEMEFIHPFTDGNGRMGRLWQTLILMKAHALFEFLPFETLIGKNQKEYYKVLSVCDKEGNSTLFIEFMLNVLYQSLADVSQEKQRAMTDSERLNYFLSKTTEEFSRKDYMNVFKKISSATASRDLKRGIELGLLEKFGDKKLSTYRIKQRKKK
jgi:Fic family protein